VKIVDFSDTGYYLLKEEQRCYFKDSLDVVLTTEEDVLDFINSLKASKEKSKVITVGDESTQTLLKENFVPDLAIIDDRVQRKNAKIVDTTSFAKIEAKNPAATITMEAWTIIKDALKKDDIKIIIKITGEEDLLVLPVILETPYNSKVLYGQPNEGLVVVTVTEEMKLKVKNLIQKMVKINEN
jgi:uncharacterized protein (UPF0218 family)